MARAWYLKSRPRGMPTPDNFALKEIELPPLREGMIRVRNAGCRSIPTCAAA